MRTFKNEEEINATGWENSDYVNYGIASKKDKNAVFFLNPGTAVSRLTKVNIPEKGCIRWGMLLFHTRAIPCVHTLTQSYHIHTHTHTQMNHSSKGHSVYYKMDPAAGRFEIWSSRGEYTHDVTNPLILLYHLFL